MNNIISLINDIGFDFIESSSNYVLKYKNCYYSIRIQLKENLEFNRYVLNIIKLDLGGGSSINIYYSDKDLISKLNTIFVEYFRKRKIKILLDEEYPK